MITDRRAELFDRIAPYRTSHIQLVLEDIYQSQNASAVLRTCDILGVQHVHVIEKRNTYTVNKDVSLGSSKWIDLHRYQTSNDPLRTCIDRLRKAGFRIVGTSPKTENSISLYDLPIEDPLAIMFGTELTGLTDRALSEVDEVMHIPMYGFTESFNISVSAAIILHHLVHRLRKDRPSSFLNKSEQLELKIRWAKSMLRDADDIEEHIKQG